VVWGGVWGRIYIWDPSRARSAGGGGGGGGPAASLARLSPPLSRASSRLPSLPPSLSLSPAPHIIEGKGCPMRGGSRPTPVLGGWGADPWGT